MATEVFRFLGVKPQHTQRMFIHTDFDAKHNILTLNARHVDINSTQEIIRIQLASEFNGHKLIGKPICVSMSKSYIIVQYITLQHKYVRFLKISRRSKTIEHIADGEFYLNKEYTTAFPIECIISPDESIALFRLPQPILNTYRLLKMLVARLNSPSNDGIYVLKNCGLVDRKYQTIIFHPACQSAIISTVVHESCQSCKMIIYQSDSKSVLLQRTHRLLKSAAGSPPDDDELGISCCVTYRSLLCEMCACKTGEFLILCCVCVKDTTVDHHRTRTSPPCLHVHVFNIDDLSLIRTYTETSSRYKTLTVTEDLIDTMFYIPTTDCSDSVIKIQVMEKYKPIRKVYSFALPRQPNLQHSCRRTILNACASGDIIHLKLPAKLLSYLQFL